MSGKITVLFVHGTGVREASYEQSHAQVQSSLTAGRSDLQVEKCYWGHLGSRLHAGGASIPAFIQSGGASQPSPEILEAALWENLYRDPFYELRMLALRGAAQTQFGQASVGDALLLKAAQLQSSGDIGKLLIEAGVDDLFARILASVIENPVCREALRAAADAPGEYRKAIARAIVARLAEEASIDSREPRLDFDGQLRSNLTNAIVDELGGADRAFLGLMAKALMGLGGQRSIEKHRGRFSELIQPFLGDILAYQGDGSRIRAHLRKRIDACDGSVVILAHSLGGIACVDLLIEQNVPQVTLLLTVGSQAPLFYELNALHSLRYPQPLPGHFPRWVNIYDMKDFLSYVGAAVFPKRVLDEPVDNQWMFPDSHSQYWSNPQVWQVIAKYI